MTLSHPLPQAARADRLCLDGVREVELPGGTRPRPIRVPYTFEAAPSGLARPPRSTSGSAAAARSLYRRAGMAAGFVWTQLTDVEGEQNGLLSDDRRPKCDPAAIRAANDDFRRR